MALVKCGECGGQVSSDAKACPKCGAAPPKGRTSTVLRWAFAGVVLLAIMQCSESQRQRDSAKEKASEDEAKRIAAMSPEQRKEADEAAARAAAEKVIKEAQFQHAVRVATALKASMKNPASFELTSLVRTNDGALCFEYRATNSFNATIPNYAVFPPNGKPVSGSSNDVAKIWNKHCAEKSGDNMTYVRRAI